MRQSEVHRRVRMLSIGQVARRLSVGETTVRRDIASGDLAAVRVGRRAWRVSEADLERFIAERSNRVDE